MTQQEASNIHQEDYRYYKVCVHCDQYIRDNNMRDKCNHDNFPAKCTVCYYRLKHGERLYI